MNQNAVIELKYQSDSWMDYQGSNDIPGDAVLACVYGLWIVADTIDETALFRRMPARGELWFHSDGDPSCVIHGPRGGDAATACRRLFEFMVRNRRHEAPVNLEEEGLITRGDYKAIIEKVRRGFEVNRKEALARPSSIVKLARRLKLNPEPDCRTHSTWYAHCPGTNHGIYIDATSNRFFCGYCGKSGGQDELRTFVESRKKAS